MLSLKDEEYVLTRAYVPEHIVSLMVLISKGEPFLREDRLCYVKNNWLIFVGYPLDENFSKERSSKILKQTIETFRPEYLWFIGPEIPGLLLDSCRERQTDDYYRLDLNHTKLKASLERIAVKASQDLTVEKGGSVSKEHQGLIAELLKREKLPARITELYRAMADYVPRSPSVCVLNARDKRGKLVAFYVIELGAKHFSTYVLGSHSKKHYVPHASDLLFYEMVKITREQGKHIINLGLGVNDGIRRFKEKWGGVPFLKYEFCEYYTGFTRTVSLIKMLEGKL